MTIRSAMEQKLTMSPALKPHPAAQLFPMMTDAELTELANDIKLRGQHRPIVVLDGKILDGRNRYEACRRAGVKPELTNWASDLSLGGEPLSPTAWVLSENLHRRHLTVDQRALIALEASTLFAQEAKARQRAAGGDRRSVHAPDRLPPQGGKRSPERAPTAAAQAAATAGVSARSVERALRVKTARPEMLEQVRAGKLTLKKAEKKIAKEERTKEVLVYKPPTGKFTVIVSDFPWPYDDQLDGSDSVRGGMDYPPMSIEEGLAMRVGETLATPDCALWFWVTNAFLIDGSATRLITGWGFTPKQCWTWRKDRMGTGHYGHNQTEHMILAIRGRPLVNAEGIANIFDAPRGAHSEKPDKAYAIIEKVTPAAPGARLDLFACKPRKGWVSSGAELSCAPGAQPSKRSAAGKRKPKAEPRKVRK